MTTLETFSVSVPAESVMATVNPVSALEEAILSRLPEAQMLLRWAIVAVANGQLLCEGSYVAA
jgi:hypothetical protein